MMSEGSEFTQNQESRLIPDNNQNTDNLSETFIEKEQTVEAASPAATSETPAPAESPTGNSEEIPVEIENDSSGTQMETTPPAEIVPIDVTKPADTEQNTKANDDALISDTKTDAESSQKQDEKNDPRKARQTHFESVFNKLKEIKESGNTINVEVKSRIKGGLRVFFEEMPVFLPTSHFSLKRNPPEEELLEVIGKSLQVKIHELQEFEDKRKTVIVSRKPVLLDELWTKLQVGDIVEGKISSVASFGVFVDIGGLEGLIHVSRLAQVHVDNPMKLYKKGDTISSVIVELDREKNRIALSRKELEKSPWESVEQEFPIDSQHTGTIRRFTDFGAYIELKHGIDGLLRTSEISWTKRIRRPSEIFKVGEKIPVFIIAISSENRTITLSYKRTQYNPWPELILKYTIGKEFEGIVQQVIQQGIIVRLDSEIDGFLPRSKMKDIIRGKKIPFKTGDKLLVEVADVNPNEESLILSLKESDEPVPITQQEQEHNRQQRQQGGNAEQSKQQSKGNSGSGTFTLLDLITDSEKKTLMKSIPQ